MPFRRQPVRTHVVLRHVPRYRLRQFPPVTSSYSEIYQEAQGTINALSCQSRRRAWKCRVRRFAQGRGRTREMASIGRFLFVLFEPTAGVHTTAHFRRHATPSFVPQVVPQVQTASKGKVTRLPRGAETVIYTGGWRVPH